MATGKPSSALAHPGGAERPRAVTELRERFVSYGYDPQEQLPRGAQARILMRLLDLYERLGLLRNGRPAALCQICPHARVCWPAAQSGVRREPREVCGEDDEDGSVSLPWVGPKYRPGGVVVIGINANLAVHDYSDLLIDHAIVWNHWIAGFRKGLKAEGGSRFGFGAMRSAAALLDVLDGSPVQDRTPEELTDTVMRIARLQAIKCVPRRGRSEPFPAMWTRCPPFVLSSELDVLKPCVLLVLGDLPRQAVEQLKTFRTKNAAGVRAYRGRLHRNGWAADVYALPHPRVGEAAERMFLRSLRRLRAPINSDGSAEDSSTRR